MIRVMAGSMRFRIIERLAQRGPQDVTQIAKAFGATLSRVSHQLGILRYAKMVITKRQSRSVVYELNRQAVSAAVAAFAHAVIPTVKS